MHQTRTKARAAGDMFYSGEECNKDPSHSRKRYTKSGSCFDCLRLRDKEAFRKRQITMALNQANSFNRRVQIFGNPDRVRGA